MAKKGFEASGRMSVEKFEQQFRAEFDVYCDILDEKGKIARQSATLASSLSLAVREILKMEI